MNINFNILMKTSTMMNIMTATMMNIMMSINMTANMMSTWHFVFFNCCRMLSFNFVEDIVNTEVETT